MTVKGDSGSYASYISFKSTTLTKTLRIRYVSKFRILQISEGVQGTYAIFYEIPPPHHCLLRQFLILKHNSLSQGNMKVFI